MQATPPGPATNLRALLLTHSCPYLYIIDHSEAHENKMEVMTQRMRFTATRIADKYFVPRSVGIAMKRLYRQACP
jgi:hypothetical protein